MNLVELERKLVAAARKNTPSDKVPYAFEKRVMARLKGRQVSDVWAVWGQALLQSAGICFAVVMLLGVVSLFIPQNNSTSSGDLSLEFEKTMLAAMDSEYSR
ncbi:MAG TPA: hypothetical protein VK327_18580 [Candidatus Paceibacterota bacterium]|nr:hypothetical protein [Candidatus Paceibacterota bacterium]